MSASQIHEMTEEIEKARLLREILTGLAEVGQAVYAVRQKLAAEQAGRACLHALELRLAREQAFGRIDAFRASLTSK